MKWNWAFKTGLFLIAITSSFANATECKSVDECITLIPEIEGKASGVGKVDDSVRNKLKSFGRDALIPLSQLTAEDDPNRRAVADSLIASIKNLNEDDFAVIHKVILNNIKFDGDGGWSYGALGYVGGGRAGRYLVSELKRVQSASNQIGTAFNRLGLEGVPFLIEGLRCFESCNEKEFRGFSEVFSNYQRWSKISDDDSARQLLGVASNEKVNLHARTTAMSVIGYITKDADIAKLIYKYADKHVEFAGSVLMSLQNMKSPLAAGLLVGRLSHDRDESSIFNSNLMVFRDLSEMEGSANKIGPQIMIYLNSNSWEDRIHAALTLGYIGYSQATPELLKLTRNEVDWQQAYAATKALNLLGDKSSIPHLKQLANTHWYKPLRDYALKAAESLKTGNALESKKHRNNFAFDFFDYQQLKQSKHVCDESDYRKLTEPEESKRYSTKESKLNSLQYKDPQCFDNDYKNSYGEYCSSEESVIFPSLAAKYGDTWLTGTNRGEWGGELVAFSSEQNAQRLLNENIEDVYVLGEHAYIITGLAHMSSNNGIIYKLTGNGSSFDIEEFYRLPGAPRTSWKVNAESVLINTVSGAVIFKPEQGLSMASCKDKD